jgi:glycolate oxidase iron-sulfur subunit
MKELAEGRAEPSAGVVEHFDRCLGCMACVTSCPSGVEYDALIEETRAYVEERHERDPSDWLLRGLVFRILPHPGRMRLALSLVPPGWAPVPRRLRPFVELAPPRSWRLSGGPPEVTRPEGARRARVGLLLGCVQRVVFGSVNAATARVLAGEGYEVVAAATQGCCGALHVHAGRREAGRELARRTIAHFEREGAELVVTNAAGCGSNLKEFGRLLRDDPSWADRARAFSATVRDVSELLAEPSRSARGPLALRVAFQDSCHLAHAQRIRDEPRAMLRSIPGLQLVEPDEQAICCGSAGIYNIVQPAPARELGARKAGHVASTGADVYASANPGCLLQVAAALRRAGTPLPALHPVELVDASMRETSAAEVLRRARR